ncbi:MAG: Fur family transcriptional regulator [Proteobacteria bacterium]|nr:MAG: Fur family transcriptional regulator [Pseudomonadota bacterium]
MIRLTVQRQAILDLINRSNQHWDAEELARCLGQNGEQLGIATVYRGLAALENAGLIQSIQLADKKRYERANKGHHDHLVCTKCGDIKEFCDSEIEMRQQQVAQDLAFHMTGHQLLIFGICESCSKDSQEDKTA